MSPPLVRTLLPLSLTCAIFACKSNPLPAHHPPIHARHSPNSINQPTQRTPSYFFKWDSQLGSQDETVGLAVQRQRAGSSSPTNEWNHNQFESSVVDQVAVALLNAQPVSRQVSHCYGGVHFRTKSVFIPSPVLPGCSVSISPAALTSSAPRCLSHQN